MRATIVCILTATVASVSAYSPPAGHAYVAPGAGDVRSPCPGLNSLANHNFIPHNGKGMTLPVLLAGLSAGMNIGDDFTTVIGAAGILSSSNPLGLSFDLNDLDEHNFPIEHDASLSRQDAYFGNDYSFNNDTFNQVLAYYEGMTQTSIAIASKAKYARVENSKAIDPTFTYGLREFILSYGETSLYLQTMSDPYSGVANLSFVKMLFQAEKLPYELGWQPPTEPVTLLTLGQMIVELFAANSPNELEEGLEVTAESYKDVLNALAATDGILGNVTAELGLKTRMARKFEA